MADIYGTGPKGPSDRAQQRALLTALNATERALRLDECRAWQITGTRGTIHTWGDGKTWVLFVVCRSVRHWTAAKARLSFCKVTQEGDEAIRPPHIRTGGGHP